MHMRIDKTGVFNCARALPRNGRVLEISTQPVPRESSPSMFADYRRVLVACASFARAAKVRGTRRALYSRQTSTPNVFSSFPREEHCAKRVTTARTMATGSDAPVLEKRQNRLAKEKSPYLLQHATNPVDW